MTARTTPAAEGRRFHDTGASGAHAGHGHCRCHLEPVAGAAAVRRAVARGQVEWERIGDEVGDPFAAARARRSSAAAARGARPRWSERDAALYRPGARTPERLASVRLQISQYERSIPEIERVLAAGDATAAPGLAWQRGCLAVLRAEETRLAAGTGTGGRAAPSAGERSGDGAGGAGATGTGGIGSGGTGGSALGGGSSGDGVAAFLTPRTRGHRIDAAMRGKPPARPPLTFDELDPASFGSAGTHSPSEGTAGAPSSPEETDWIHFSPEELATARRLQALGVHVVSVLKGTATGVRYPDAVIPRLGVTLEMKDVKSSRYEPFKAQGRSARGQSARVVLDMVGPDVGEEVATVFLRRLLGAHGGLEEVLVLGPSRAPNLDWSPRWHVRWSVSGR